MQTNPAVEQNKSVKWSESPWKQSGRKGKGLWRKWFAKEPGLELRMKDWTSKRRWKWWWFVSELTCYVLSLVLNSIHTLSSGCKTRSLCLCRDTEVFAATGQRTQVFTLYQSKLRRAFAAYFPNLWEFFCD